MPSIKVHQKTKSKGDAAFKKLKKYCDTKLILKELGNLKPEVEWDDEEQKGWFDEKGVKGEISVNTATPCTITITLEIPFLMLPFKRIIETSVQNHLGKFA